MEKGLDNAIAMIAGDYQGLLMLLMYALVLFLAGFVATVLLAEGDWERVYPAFAGEFLMSWDATAFT